MSLKEFVKIAVGLREHPKVIQAGDDGGWLYVCAIMWSKEHDTDGFIPAHVVPRLTGLKRPNVVAKKLVSAGLLEEFSGGFRIHDYLNYQESAEKRSAAGRKAAAARWSGNRAAEPNGKCDPHANRTAIASESHADRNANAMRSRITEEEEEKRKTPPDPPMGGRERDRLRYGLEFNSWVAECFPGVQPSLVEFCVQALRRQNQEPTIENLRPLIDAGGVFPRKPKEAA